MRNSKIIIAKGIKLDKEYRNVLDFSESDMLSLVNANKVAESDTYSFIKDTGNISVHFNFNDCIYCDYMAFQNPDYDNKWFFAFIDDATYINDGVTELHYTIDVWSTWFGRLTTKPCFVVREHVNDDTRGLHTVPENLETGEYIVTRSDTYEYTDYYMVAGITDNILKQTDPLMHNKYNGVISGITYIALQSEIDVNHFIFRYNNAGKVDAITSLFMVPSEYIDNVSWITDDTGTVNFQYISKANGVFEIGSMDVIKPTIIGEGESGYIPKNNKVLTFPYCYLYVDNNAGAGSIYQYEHFTAPEGAIYDTCRFDVSGTISPGCNIKFTPVNYKNCNFNYSESLNGAKLPLGGWINDTFTNWLTQNGVNIAVSGLSSLVQLAGGVVSASSGVGAGVGAFQIANATVGIASTVGAVYQHSLIPDQAMGNANSSDISYALNYSGATFYEMSIKKEYAKIIDNYFSLYGYKVNTTKNPNITGRQNYNFIQIAESENLGYGEIPAKAMEMIDNIARRGVTIWHNHTNLGDFSVTNNIV